MIDEKQLDIILYKLAKVSTYDLKNYARKSLMRRIDRFIVNHQASADKIVYNLGNVKGYADQLVEEITVNTTELFRDVKIWQSLGYNVLTKLRKRNKINIWLAGVSSGQEAYSLMILLNELDLLHQSHIIATDINESILDKAKSGRYKYRNNIDYLASFDQVIKRNPFDYTDIKDVPYDKYFSIDKAADEIIMHDFLRTKPVFLKHDLVTDGALKFTKFDLILCRNVLIYFDQHLQNSVLQMFHSAMFPNSYMALGIHESILGSATQLFMKKGVAYMNK